MKPIIAHCRTNFLPVTETFIENQIRNLVGFDSIILAREASENFRSGGEFEVFCKKNANLEGCLGRMAGKEEDFFVNIIKEKNIGILHAHFGLDARYFLPLKKKTGLPLAVSFYGYDAYRLPKVFFGAGAMILSGVFKSADLIIVPSKHMKKQLIGLGCGEGKIEVLCWGISPLSTKRSPNPAKRDGASGAGEGSGVRFLHIGRIVEKKGQIYLLRAFKEILGRGVNAELTIIGDGPLKKKLYKTIDKFKICDKVRVICKLSNEDVIREIVSHNIYIQPSVEAADGDQEGVPTAIMEAFSCGLPVISTTHSGIPEIVENNVSGILVPERDSVRLADAMEKLAKNPELCVEMGRNGRRTIEERFDARKQAGKLAALYRSLLT